MRRHLCREKRASQHAPPPLLSAEYGEQNAPARDKRDKLARGSLAKRRCAGTTTENCISFPFYELLGRSCLRHSTDILRFRLPRKLERPFVSDNILGISASRELRWL